MRCAAGQSHERSYQAEELSPIGVRVGGDESASFDAALTRGGIETDQVQGEVFEDGQVVGGMAGAGTHASGRRQRRPLSLHQIPEKWLMDNLGLIRPEYV